MLEPSPEEHPMAAKKKTATKKPVKKPVKKQAASTARRTATARPVRHQPESLRLREASPSFTVNDINRSVAFYRDVLGFTLGETYEEHGVLLGAQLKAGDVELWLSQDDWQKGRGRVKGVGCRIFFTTVQDIDEIARKIKAMGGTLLHEPETQSWGMRDIGIEDPDGFRLTIAMPVKQAAR
jgi:uncharacterized glyoxalase superfamily protein PhnB